MALSGGGTMHSALLFSLIISQSCTFFAMTIDHCSNDFSFIFSNVDDIWRDDEVEEGQTGAWIGST
jgi:hypothetical protein